MVRRVSTDDKTPRNIAALTRLAFGLTLAVLFGAVAAKAVMIGANMEDVFVGLGSDSVKALCHHFVSTIRQYSQMR